jgi:homoserine/homoserine lactone efflux protein
MDITLFLGFIAATAIIVCTPGPSVALASAQAVRHGPRAAGVCVAGDALGSVVHIVIATASLSYLVALAGHVLPWLQIAGGLYILYLAGRAFTEAHDMDPSSAAGQRASFFSGFFACVTNPKAIVFFAALFPGFISQDHNIWVQSLIYGLVFVTLDAVFIMGYALVAWRAYRSPLGAKISVSTLSGIGLFGVGSLLIYKGVKALAPQ